MKSLAITALALCLCTSAFAGGEGDNWGQGGGPPKQPPPTQPPPSYPPPVVQPIAQPISIGPVSSSASAAAQASASAKAVNGNVTGSNSLRLNQSFTLSPVINVTQPTGTSATGLTPSPAATGAGAVGLTQAAANRPSTQTVTTETPSYPVNPAFAPSVQGTAPCTQSIDAAVTNRWISVSVGAQYDLLPRCQDDEDFRILAPYDLDGALERKCLTDEKYKQARENLGRPCGRPYSSYFTKPAPEIVYRDREVPVPVPTPVVAPAAPAVAVTPKVIHKKPKPVVKNPCDCVKN